MFTIKLADILNVVFEDVKVRNQLEALNNLYDLDQSIEHITVDNRDIKPNSLFILIEGESYDPHDHLENLTGATFLIAEKEINTIIPHVIYPNIKHKLAKIYSNFYGNPQDKMVHIGITGTNGKTSTGAILQNILKDYSHTSYIGTLGIKINEESAYLNFDTPTTPQVTDLYPILSHFSQCKVETNIMEVSSHGLDQGRVKGVDFKYAIFTNLTNDHLDYHETMDHYLNAKKKLFDGLTHDSFAIINADDKYFSHISSDTSAQVFTYGINNSADLTAKNIELNANGMSFLVNYNNEAFQIDTKLTGVFNVYNILSSISVLILEGINFNDIQESISNFKGIPGRLEKIIDKNLNVFVDYAHTPDGLLNVLKTLKNIKGNSKLITVFGCGGDRDKTKRPIMGQIAAQLSDKVYITSDNPRTEDGQCILNDIRKGVDEIDLPKIELILDRKDAIENALTFANKGCLILIAGKGHENYQIIGNKKIYFDDRLIVKNYLSKTQTQRV